MTPAGVMNVDVMRSVFALKKLEGLTLERTTLLKGVVAWKVCSLFAGKKGKLKDCFWRRSARKVRVTDAGSNGSPRRAPQPFGSGCSGQGSVWSSLSFVNIFVYMIILYLYMEILDISFLETCIHTSVYVYVDLHLLAIALQGQQVHQYAEENQECECLRKLTHHVSIHPLQIGELSFSPRNHSFCRRRCLPWTWLGRSVQFIGIWILSPLKTSCGLTRQRRENKKNNNNNNNHNHNNNNNSNSNNNNNKNNDNKNNDNNNQDDNKGL